MSKISLSMIFRVVFKYYDISIIEYNALEFFFLTSYKMIEQTHRAEQISTNSYKYFHEIIFKFKKLSVKISCL